jgi:hypothetical protein
MRVAFGPREGQRVRRIGHAFGYEGEAAQLVGKRCASANGFTLHANRYIGMKDRLGLERILAYGARGCFSNQRLSLADPDDPAGDLTYSLKAPAHLLPRQGRSRRGRQRHVAAPRLLSRGA